ncbi:hypothetical protein U9M48_004160 [Paspalum notatum var. saurae]|uniref:Reverse transcriptase Ty1/copia-type domain-containing protein n=1 Tax=Paspalum notatum var. saurae TaxID=547442 RepID=A0AAQ3PU86_PASNO
MYGPKQAPRAWYQRFATFIRQLGFVASTSDTSLFIFREGTSLAYLLLYVDDIVLTASSSALLRRIMTRLSSEFAMTDLGDLHHFLGIAVTRSSMASSSPGDDAVELLQRAGMAECHPTPTPVDTHAKLSATDGVLPSAKDASEYGSLAGALRYRRRLVPIRPMPFGRCASSCTPRASLTVRLSSASYASSGGLSPRVFTLAPAPSTRRSPTRRRPGGLSGLSTIHLRLRVYLGDNLISWSSKRRTTVSRSGAEAEYRAVAHVVAECRRLRRLLRELHIRLPSATVVFATTSAPST